MKPDYYYPVKPEQVNRVWGFYDPQDYSQFGFTNHNGVDWAPGADKLWRYPWSGTGTVIRVGNQPQGGGIFCGIISNELFDFPDGKQAYILTDALHAEKILVKEGDIVKTGDPIIIQDNTGFSTGVHTHEQDRREEWIESQASPNAYRNQSGMVLTDVDKNDANNSFNPLDYATGGYAYQLQEIGLLQKVVDLLKQLLK